jgi:hypothetical protein
VAFCHLSDSLVGITVFRPVYQIFFFLMAPVHRATDSKGLFFGCRESLLRGVPPDLLRRGKMFFQVSVDKRD